MTGGTNIGGRSEAAADLRVVGFVGTSCSVAAATASPILSEAGLVMISAGNTAPLLTSDLQGNAGSNYHPGYFRTISNDLHQAQAVSDFVYNSLGLRRMATIHDGDLFTNGLTSAFARSFVALGGRITGSARVRKGDVDMSAALTGIAAAEPEGIFFPLFPDEAGRVVRQINLIEGGEKLVLINSESLLFTQLDSMDAYLAGPDFDFTGNVNQTTGRNAEQLAAEYRQLYGETANPAYLALAYDAATLLLRAIEESRLSTPAASISNATGCGTPWPLPTSSEESAASSPATNSATAAPAASPSRATPRTTQA